jgi:hypothetical protein
VRLHVGLVHHVQPVRVAQPVPAPAARSSQARARLCVATDTFSGTRAVERQGGREWRGAEEKGRGAEEGGGSEEESESESGSEREG